MPYQSGLFNVDLEPIYVNLGNSLGAYVVEPGETPFIVLNLSLKDRPDPTAQLVYHSLLAYANTLHPVYQLFPLVKYFEELPEAQPVTAQPTQQQPVQPEIIIFGRATRRWHLPVYLPERFRLIG